NFILFFYLYFQSNELKTLHCYDRKSPIEKIKRDWICYLTLKKRTYSHRVATIHGKIQYFGYIYHPDTHLYQEKHNKRDIN
ncbi:MAG: hypothetical protein PHG62_07650, partial [Proteiniphilum sp.]|nr:hypothetical protein [Proteiniphilum sp.]